MVDVTGFLQELTPKDFMNILITIFIAMFFVVFWYWRVDLQDCTERCVACIELREQMKKMGMFDPHKEAFRMTYSASIRAEMNVSPWVGDLMECTNKKSFNLSEWLECSRITH